MNAIAYVLLGAFGCAVIAALAYGVYVWRPGKPSAPKTAGDSLRLALETAGQELENARKVEEQFLANMSHEIRTPMNGIQGMARLLRGTALTAEQQEFVGTIHRLVEQLGLTVDDILDYTKIKTGERGNDRPEAGASVSIVGNGEEAVGLLERERFDLIIMDLQMPVMDGYEATRQLRGKLGLDTPVLAMTAGATQGGRKRCLEAGMNDYMLKPFEIGDFYLRIMQLLKGITATHYPIPSRSRSESR
jgi:CheY-like chemotaxis protein